MTEDEFRKKTIVTDLTTEEEGRKLLGKVGVKYDAGKPRYDLLPVWPLQQVADLYGMGAAKYSDRQWELGMRYGKVYAAMQRHANAWWGGETRDPVDGQHHLASVVWCALVLMEYEHRKTGEDDRPYSDTKQLELNLEKAKRDWYEGRQAK